MDEKIFDRYLSSFNRTNKLLTAITIAAGVVIYFQCKKIDRLNEAINILKNPTGDQTPNA